VVNDATCNAKVQSDCRVVATAPAGASPTAAAIDEQTDTVYFPGAAGTVTVLDGARCNATVTSGCGKDLATIQVGGSPVAAAVDPLTNTLYVADSQSDDVSVVNIARCNALTTTGCGQPVKTVQDSNGPQALDVDVATDTVYTADAGSGDGDTVSVINGARCNGSDSSGCGSTPPTVTVGSGAWWVAVDQASDTIYAANNNDGTVSVIDGARCNASTTSGCHRAPRAVYAGAAPQFVAVDGAAHTLFTVNSDDDTLSEINTRTCNGAVTSGCPKLARDERAAADQSAETASFPNTVVLAPTTDSAYLVSVGGPNVLSVVNISHCQASDTSGCRALPEPSVPDPEALAAVDPATHTIYASNDNLAQIDVLNAATCDVRDLAGCHPVAEMPMSGPQAGVGAIDDRTGTLYISGPSGTISVVSTATCNATETTGCRRAHPSIRVGLSPGVPVINQASETLYVPLAQVAIAVVVTRRRLACLSQRGGNLMPSSGVRPAWACLLRITRLGGSAAQPGTWPPDSSAAARGRCQDASNLTTGTAPDLRGFTLVERGVGLGRSAKMTLCEKPVTCDGLGGAR
jgi:DNA-binding beta-propeller fold protein YncE